MVTTKPTTAIIQNTNYTKSDGTCGLALRVTFARKKKYYKLPISLTVEDYNKAKGEKPRGVNRVIAMELKEYEVKAKQIIDSMLVFSFDKFEKHFYLGRAAQQSVFSAFENYISALIREDRYGTASSYDSAIKSLSKFKKDLSFIDIDKDFLVKYEKWMSDTKRSKTTVGIYLRALRVIINQAIQDGHLQREYYPFGRGLYTIPTSNNPKLALDRYEIKRIARLELKKGSSIKRARDYWVFLFLGNGMDMIDMAHLTYQNVKPDSIEFERIKTKNTRRVTKRIVVKRTNELNKIIKEWANNRIDDTTYLFPILEKGLTKDISRKKVQQATRELNKKMKKIQDLLEIDKRVSTHVARHSFATTIKRSSIGGVAFISDALGHSNIRTTENYLAGFEDETRNQAAAVLNDLIQEDED